MVHFVGFYHENIILGLDLNYMLGFLYFVSVPYVNPQQTVHLLCMPQILHSYLFLLRLAFIGFPAL
jgi:hypothetical protein